MNTISFESQTRTLLLLLLVLFLLLMMMLDPHNGSSSSSVAVLTSPGRLPVRYYNYSLACPCGLIGFIGLVVNMIGCVISKTSGSALECTYYAPRSICICGRSTRVPMDLRRRFSRSDTFLLHQSILNILQSVLSLMLAFDLSMFTCNLVASSYVTLATASICNTAAAAVSETFFFEELENMSSNEADHVSEPPDPSAHPTVTDLLTDPLQQQQRSATTNPQNHGCSCFGIVIVWLTATVLHLGITLIGTDASMFFPDGHCRPFQVRTGRTYILYSLWIVTNTFVLALTTFYLVKQRTENHRFMRMEPPLVSLLGIQSATNLFQDRCHNIPPQQARQDLDEQFIWVQPVQRQIIDVRMKTYLLFVLAFVVTYTPLFTALIIDFNFVLSPLVIGVLFCLAQTFPILNSLLRLALVKHLFWRPKFDPIVDYYTRVGRRFNDKLAPNQQNRDDHQQKPTNKPIAF